MDAGCLQLYGRPNLGSLTRADAFAERFLRQLRRASRCVRVHMAAVPADDFTAALDTVEKRTRAAIEALRGLEAIAQSNDLDNAAIPLCLESVVKSFEQIRACEASVGGVHVPRDVVESVDQGRNPDAFLAELAERNAAACRATAWSKRPPWQCPSSAPAPPQGAPGGSGWRGTPRAMPSHWAPCHRLGCSSKPPPKPPIPPPLTMSPVGATLGKTSAMDALARSVQQQAQESGLLEPVPRRTSG